MKYVRASFLVFIVVIAGSACSYERKSSLDPNPNEPTPNRRVEAVRKVHR